MNDNELRAIIEQVLTEMNVKRYRICLSRWKCSKNCSCQCSEKCRL